MTMSPYWIHFLAGLSLLGSAIHYLSWHGSVRRGFMAETGFVSCKRKKLYVGGTEGRKQSKPKEESSALDFITAPFEGKRRLV